MTGGTIIIEGNIGAGKSTFAKYLAEEIAAYEGHCDVVREPDQQDNPFLDDYYKDPKGTAYKMQLFLMHRRFRDMVCAQDRALYGAWSVFDRSFWGDMCFAYVQANRGYFSQAEMDAYLEAHTQMVRQLNLPRSVVFLDASPETCLRRIQTRMRSCECGIELDYLQELDEEYDSLISAFDTATRVYRCDWNEDITEDEIRAVAKDTALAILARRAHEDQSYRSWLI